MEAALAVAREGLTADPPVQPPPALRRYLGFKKLSVPVLRAIARVVDADDEFRARVAAGVDEVAVGPAGVLWLTRPEGWDDELSKLEAHKAATAAASADAREERDARRRLASARAAADRATAAAHERAAKLDGMRAELGVERSRRAAAEQRIAELEALLGEAQAARESALREQRGAEARVVELTADARAARAQLAELSRAPAASDRPSEDLRRFGEAVHAVARRAAELADELRVLEESTVAGPDVDLDRVAGSRHRPARSEAEAEAAAVARRQAVALPPGLHDDSVDVVDHLLRVPGMLLLVDGYNVSMVGWPEESVREQRRRLLTALEEKALRTGAPIEVVFDGAEVDGVGVRAQGRPMVRVRFSPPGIEADDVLLDLVAQLPTRRPVTVASSDNRVRDGTRLRGGNLLHSRQLLDALRR